MTCCQIEFKDYNETSGGKVQHSRFIIVNKTLSDRRTMNVHKLPQEFPKQATLLNQVSSRLSGINAFAATRKRHETYRERRSEDRYIKNFVAVKCINCRAKRKITGWTSCPNRTKVDDIRDTVMLVYK